MNAPHIDRILEQLVRDVEATVTASLASEEKHAAARLRLQQLIHEARQAILAAPSMSPTPGSGSTRAAPRVSSPRPRVSGPMVAGAAFGWTDEDSDAVLKCITSWLPVSAPASTPAESKCIAPGKMLIPTWGERERAREALKRITEV